MPWCPKCGVEYREGFETCSDCGCALVETPEEIEAVAVEEEEAPNPFVGGETFLVSVADSIEADMIEGLMNENRIPVLKKYGTVGGEYLEIFMGKTNMGVDLYVPSFLFAKALKLLQENQGTLEEFAISDEELEAQALAAAPVDGEEDEEDDEYDEYGDDEEDDDDSDGDKEDDDSDGDGTGNKDGVEEDEYDK
jgi:hypothetical protein